MQRLVHSLCLWCWCLRRNELSIPRTYNVRFWRRRAEGCCAAGKQTGGEKLSSNLYLAFSMQMIAPLIMRIMSLPLLPYPWLRSSRYDWAAAPALADVPPDRPSGLRCTPAATGSKHTWDTRPTACAVSRIASLQCYLIYVIDAGSGL